MNSIYNTMYFVYKLCKEKNIQSINFKLEKKPFSK